MSASRKFLRELIESEEGQEQIRAIWRDATEKRKREVWVPSREVKYDKDGTKHVRTRKIPMEIEVYDLKNVISILSFAASFGIGKPPEEKRVQVEVRQGLPLGELTNEELDVLEAEYEELGDDDQPALPSGD